MFGPAPTGRRGGFDLSHLYQPTDVEVWPENWAAVQLFDRVGTQWRTGACGAIGLDYCSVYPVMDRMQLGGQDWMQMLDDIRAMEHAALEQMRDSAGKETGT